MLSTISTLLNGDFTFVCWTASFVFATLGLVDFFFPCPAFFFPVPVFEFFFSFEPFDCDKTADGGQRGNS